MSVQDTLPVAAIHRVLDALDNRLMVIEAEMKEIRALLERYLGDAAQGRGLGH